MAYLAGTAWSRADRFTLPQRWRHYKRIAFNIIGGRCTPHCCRGVSMLLCHNITTPSEAAMRLGMATSRPITRSDAFGTRRRAWREGDKKTTGMGGRRQSCSAGLLGILFVNNGDSWLAIITASTNAGERRCARQTALSLLARASSSRWRYLNRRVYHRAAACAGCCSNTAHRRIGRA